MRGFQEKAKAWRQGLEGMETRRRQEEEKWERMDSRHRMTPSMLNGCFLTPRNESVCSEAGSHCPVIILAAGDSMKGWQTLSDTMYVVCTEIL